MAKLGIPPALPMTKQDGQKAVTYEDAFLLRGVSMGWRNPRLYDANAWRLFVKSQMIAVDCKEALKSQVLNLDWKISVRDSNMQDEHAAAVKYYTKLITNSSATYSDYDYPATTEFLLDDYLDLPFGGAAEIGRRNDEPNGRVQWVDPLDGATLYPTLNKDYPVAQQVGIFHAEFPYWDISRIYNSPRPEIERRGWGIAPPEKIFYAMEMLSKGDQYYANLLLDIPTAGILDLGDMEEGSAKNWVAAYKSFLANGGTSSFQIPVLYEHTTETKFIPFGKVPNDIMYDRITLKYAAIVCAAYGVSLSDIGIQGTSSGGETLAGSIREERKTRKTGVGKAKQKLTYFWNRVLPDFLRFDFIDFDDELNVSNSRARLANATAAGTLIDKLIFSPAEIRRQLIADGMITVSVPEKYPEDEKPEPPKPTVVAQPVVGGKKTPERPGALGKVPQPVSEGGHGEATIRSAAVEGALEIAVMDIGKKTLAKYIELAEYIGEDFGRDILNNMDDFIVGEMPMPEYEIALSGVKSPETVKSIINTAIAIQFSQEFTNSGIDVLASGMYDYIVERVYKNTLANLDTLVSNSKEL
jgi:hypothetical protein